MKRKRIKAEDVQDDVELDRVSGSVTDAHQRADYETQLLIDPDALDENIMRQPQTFNDVGERHAEAISRRDEQEDRLKRAEARAQFEVRQSMDEAGDKVTEPAVKAKVLLHPKVREELHKLREMEREAALWAVLKESFHQRSHMLGHMAKLYESGFYASASVSGRAPRKLQQDAYEANRARMADARRGQ